MFASRLEALALDPAVPFSLKLREGDAALRSLEQEVHQTQRQWRQSTKHALEFERRMKRLEEEGRKRVEKASDREAARLIKTALHEEAKTAKASERQALKAARVAARSAGASERQALKAARLAARSDSACQCSREQPVVPEGGGAPAQQGNEQGEGSSNA
jgi:hypothetical protein